MDELLSEAISAWQMLNPFTSWEFLPILVWLSHKVGAASFNPTEVDHLRAYLNAGGNPDARVDRWGNTLLHKAVERESVEAVSLLLSRKANPNLPNFEGTPPLHYLLYTKNYYPPYKTPDETTELLFALLVASGADPDLRDGEGRSFKDLIKEAIEHSKNRGRSWKELNYRDKVKGFLKKVSNPKAFAQEKMLEALAAL